MRRFGTQRSSEKVYLNIYDLHESNEYLYPVGLGSFHSGVEVSGTEYTFGGGSGIFNHEPKAVPNAKLRESVLIGEIIGSSSVDGAINSLVQRLTGRPIPSYVNRLAEIGGCCSCLFPPSMLGQAPVNDGSLSSSMSGSYGVGSRRTNSTDMRSNGAVNFSNSKGFKLGDSSLTKDQDDVPLLSEEDRRQRIREANLRRFSTQKDSL